ncbi:DUF4301 family protein [Croceiramulus getboli]|nr:DUF4301 family protein [Flavobacteriaceae bacterium YJPT1-3]
MNFTANDKVQIEAHGLTLETVSRQLAVFRQGIPTVQVQREATLGDGIRKMTNKEIDQYVQRYEREQQGKDLLKFTPASGAATRMFKFLYEFLDKYDLDQQTINAFINKTRATDLRLFFVGLDSFPFFREVRAAMIARYVDGDSTDINLNRVRFVKTMLTEDGLNYGAYPKGLFPFHKYKDHNASAFEEHLFEASKYAAKAGEARLHFTISKQHYNNFKEEYKRIQDIVERKTNTRFKIDVSYQEPKTDTLAVNLNNEPYRDGQGRLFFRPGGHGALLDNLNEQEADIIFVKNIDNVVVFKYEDEIARYKKMLAGYLLEIQNEVFQWLDRMDRGEVGVEDVETLRSLLSDQLGSELPDHFAKYSLENQLSQIRELLDRPIRVCGMVRNEGEPGGGPFWVKNDNGIVSLQIVEGPQMDRSDPRQMELLSRSTHFNPVDLVCGVKNYKGKRFDLVNYRDPKLAFIAQKSIGESKIRALEHPGLWNGAMAHWNTAFVEVPLITFNPVKTVNDLLKPAHQVPES